MARQRGKKRSPTRAADEGKDPPLLFPVGAEVEVCSNDEGSFYEATVDGHLPSSSGGRRRYYVVTYARRRKDGTSAPVREDVAAANVRPRPPASGHHQQPAQEFAVHDMVEAFHRQGWWAGVVCHVAQVPDDHGGTTPPPPLQQQQQQQEQSRRVYSVCLRTTRELLQFDHTRLRPRLVFLVQEQRWIKPAPEEEKTSPLFEVGNQVEVSGSQNFARYWSPATIVKVIDSKSFVVLYETVREDGQVFAEIVDAQYIRPVRDTNCRDSKYRFCPSCSVEVFHDGSWCPGVILRVLEDKVLKKFVVKINGHEDMGGDVQSVGMLTVEHTKLRLRYDWCDGQWVRHSAEKQFGRGSLSKSARRQLSLTVDSSNDIGNIAALTSSKDSEIRDECGPSTLGKVNNADDIVQTKQKLSSYYEETVKQPNSVQEVASPLALPSQQSVSGSGLLKYDPKFSSCNPPQLPCQTMLPESAKSGECASMFGPFRRPRTLTQGPVSGNQSLNTDFSSIGGAKGAFSDLEKKKQLSDKGSMAEAQQEINPRLPVETALNRKRMNECTSSQTPEEPGENPEIVLTKKRIVDKNAELCKVARNDHQQHEDDIAKNDHQQHEDNIDDLVQSNTSVGPIDNVSNTVVASDNCEANPKVDKGVAGCHGDKMESPGIMLETQHVSTDGPFSAASLPAPNSESAANEQVQPAVTQLPCAANGSSSSPESEHGNRLSEPKDAGTPICKDDKHSESTSVDNLPFGNLPFKKKSSMWAEFEAMVIFHEMPQRPNFQRLQHYGGGAYALEGIALGLIGTFATLVEDIKKLKIDDDKSLLEEKKGISILEEHGFDVRHLRSRLEVLLLLKNGAVELLGANKKLEEKIAHKETVLQQRAAQFGMLTSAKNDLRLQASLVRCTIQSLVSQKISCALEISELKAKFCALKHKHLALQKRFANE